MFFPENTYRHFFLNIMSLKYAKFQIANEWEKKQLHYNIIVVATRILILG